MKYRPLLLIIAPRSAPADVNRFLQAYLGRAFSLSLYKPTLYFNKPLASRSVVALGRKYFSHGRFRAFSRGAAASRRLNASYQSSMSRSTIKTTSGRWYANAALAISLCRAGASWRLKTRHRRARYISRVACVFILAHIFTLPSSITSPCALHERHGAKPDYRYAARRARLMMAAKHLISR